MIWPISNLLQRTLKQQAPACQVVHGAREVAVNRQLSWLNPKDRRQIASESLKCCLRAVLHLTGTG